MEVMMVKKRGVYVKDPSSAVLIDNVTNGILDLAKADGGSVLVQPNETVQVTWAEYVGYKSKPGFGKCIKLNDSVDIIDGHIRISNVTAQISENEMITIFVQSLPNIKEYILLLNPGELKIFSSFISAREKLGVDPEKCVEILKFMATFKEKATPKKKSGKAKKVIESKDSLATIVVDRGES